VAPLKRYTVGTDDPGERAQALADWSEHAEELRERLEGDLGSPQPRPDWQLPAGRGTPSRPGAWSGEVVAGRAEGAWTFSRPGVVTREETYAHGRRHGPATRWHVVEDRRPDSDADDLEDDPFVYRQGHVEREGAYVDGAAHGVFRFLDKSGWLLQEGPYEHGWPQGRWTVHPAATRGVAEPASVDYDSGVPAGWSIPPTAFDSVQLRQRKLSANPHAPCPRQQPGHGQAGTKIAWRLVTQACGRAQCREHEVYTDLGDGDPQSELPLNGRDGNLTHTSPWAIRPEPALETSVTDRGPEPGRSG
jgi:hypothetical protein